MTSTAELAQADLTTDAVPQQRPVAVFLSRFPSVTETFILREVTELERQGQSVRLVPMLEESPNVIHDDARPWIRRAPICCSSVF